MNKKLLAQDGRRFISHSLEQGFGKSNCSMWPVVTPNMRSSPNTRRETCGRFGGHSGGHRVKLDIKHFIFEVLELIMCLA